MRGKLFSPLGGGNVVFLNFPTCRRLFIFQPPNATNMAWIEITEAHVLQRATFAELVANNNAGTPIANALAPSPVKYDPLQATIKSATVEIRGAIAEGKKTRLDSNTKTIPASLLNVALSIIVYRYASRLLSQEIVVQDARYQEYSRALDALDEIRKGKRTVEDPETDEFTDNAGSQTVTAQGERFSRRELHLF